MREILSDLVAEQQSLDQLLQRTPVKEWKRPTPAKGWTIQDTVSHLATSEELVYDALEEGGHRLAAALASPIPGALTNGGIERGRSMRPQDVLEWWRESRARVVDALSHRRPDDRTTWLVGDLGARSFATSRLMETWAHGLDVHATLKRDPEDTARLRHVAWLAWRMLPYAFEVTGEPHPGPIRVEVMGPAYAKWVFGPDDASEVVKGAAGEWCRVAVQRLPLKQATTLKAIGSTAETALRVVRAYV